MALSASGKQLIIGAPEWYPDLNNTGDQDAVFAYTSNGKGGWLEQLIQPPYDQWGYTAAAFISFPGQNPRFGSSVGISDKGKILAFGAQNWKESPSEVFGKNSEGAMWIYRLSTKPKQIELLQFSGNVTSVGATCFGEAFWRACCASSANTTAA